MRSHLSTWLALATIPVVVYLAIRTRQIERVSGGWR